MTEPHDCHDCPAFGEFCEGNTECAADCHELEGWLDPIGGLALDAPLAPQLAFDPSSPSGQALPPFFPQLLNGLEVPSMLAREPAVAVGIAKALTPGGKVSRRAIPAMYSTRSLRAQWGLGQDTLLLCLGNTLDGYLERLWAAQADENTWGHLGALGFDAATSLNFSIYLDRPRLEHLVNIKRSWLTVRRMQQTSGLVPIPHLQWATIQDLQRQLRYAREQGFHTLALNLQMFKRQGWETVAAGLPVIREQAPDLRLLFAGVVSLKRMAYLAMLFPTASFTNTTAHYLAQRHVRLRRDDIRLIKEPVDGHPDLILAENIRLYRDFLHERAGQVPQLPPPGARSRLYAAQQEIAAALHTRFGFDSTAASDAAGLLAVDESILAACQAWLRSGEVDRGFRGSLPAWPCAEAIPHPTLGELLDQGADPLDAFLHLAHLAGRVDDEVQVFVGRAGH
jgi:hypothetical protein